MEKVSPPSRQPSRAIRRATRLALFCASLVVAMGGFHGIVVVPAMAATFGAPEWIAAPAWIWSHVPHALYYIIRVASAHLAATPAMAAEVFGPNLPTDSHSAAGAIGALGWSTFGPGGPASMIAQLMLIAVVGWLAGYIAQAAGKGQIAGMIHVTSVFCCIAIVANVAYSAIEHVAHFFA